MLNFTRRIRSLLASWFSADDRVAGSTKSAARVHTAASFQKIARAAHAGEAQAQFEVGRAYLMGESVPPSPADAIFWLEKAAASGFTEAQYLLASMAMQGLTNIPSSGLFGSRADVASMAGRRPNYELARTWAQKAADGGSSDAKALLACLYNYGPQDWHDPATARLLNQEAAAADSAQGRLGLATFLLARGRAEDGLEAREQLQAACEAGHPGAHLLLGSLEHDPMVATEHYRIAAEAGLPGGKLRYGKALMEGSGVARDVAAGEGWLRRAALEGEAEAACLVADIYLGTDGLPANLAEGANWLRCAAELGDAAAARRLGMVCLRQGDGLEASGWLQRAAALGDDAARIELAQIALFFGAPAQSDLREWLAAKGEAGDLSAVFNLGLCCAEGVGGENDDRAAIEQFRRAATAIPAARYWVGRMKIEGRGIEQDLANGRAWLERAASEGVVEAQLLAAEMMVNGRGGERDVSGGHELFERLAATGNAGAMYSLGVLKAGGHGIPPDPEKALGHFREAAKQGHPRAALMAGRYLAHGIGAPVNRVEAGDYLRRAREFHREEAEQELVRLLDPA